ncbi:KPB2-like protein [Mya arenaria]|uniref:Phosphorylase b kinase regulatory subunit n=1 Tax=Mya arenaria TaxID=6604 RepID=A0ABY7DNZ8_MYAAR|nr:KPB2-like protein [Mya arenaria]
MRNRSNSGVRLDYYQRLVTKTILKQQNPVTGLFGTAEHSSHAWVRDNVYTILAVWGVALAYRKNADLDEDLAKAYELEQSVVKLMRGLLRCMMLQVDKLEKFKKTQSPRDCLHAKYSSLTGKTVVGDKEWGHLQIDATSLFILYLAQMTAAELNSSSIGMAKAALEAINEVDLFGARGGQSSVIHALPDEAQQCQAILHSMLPRESNSKEIDAALITVISFPAFAVDDIEIINRTRKEIEEKLMGKHGCIRFLRDGYKTAREDPNRLHYEPWELLMFEKIENQWPVFYAYFILDGLYRGDTDSVEKYKELLEPLIIKSEDGIPSIPEMYSVPKDKVEQEIRHPHSQVRQLTGKKLHMWGQSLYILGRLVDEKFISPGELDPLNRRLITEPRPDVVVQVVIVAEDVTMQNLLASQGIYVQTMSEVSPIQVYPARVLSQIYSLLGKNKRMGLTGRPSSEIGLLATSKLYILQDEILAFIPQFVDQHQFYLPLDIDFLVDTMKNHMDDLARNWRMMGRPTFICPMNNTMLDQYMQPPSSLIGTIRKLQSGYIAGTRVHLGQLSDFVSTSCVTKLSFVQNAEESGTDTQILDIIGDVLKRSSPRPRLLSMGRKASKSYKSSSVRGIVRRSRSITVDAQDVPELSHPHLKGTHSPFQSPYGTPHTSPPSSPKASHRAWPHMDKFSKDATYQNVNVHEIVQQLALSENLNEQADIIHYLYVKMGPDWDTEVDSKSCTVKELLVELYEKAATDLLVRQKQFPLPPDELAAIIYEACGEDLSTASLTQKLPAISVQPNADDMDDEMEDRQGQWLRRRRLDGALNRVPVGFYTQVWQVLQKCHGLSICNNFLAHSLTREMTSGEFKFALQVERVLNMIPQPEYRQLMVEALMVTTLLVDGDCKINLSGQVIHVDKIVHMANDIFIEEQI